MDYNNLTMLSGSRFLINGYFLFRNLQLVVVVVLISVNVGKSEEINWSINLNYV